MRRNSNLELESPKNLTQRTLDFGAKNYGKSPEKAASSTFTIRKREKSSVVWDFLQQGPDGKHAVCKICKETVLSRGNTTNYMTHLKRHRTIQLGISQGKIITVTSSSSEDNGNDDKGQGEDSSLRKNIKKRRKRKHDQTSLLKYTKKENTELYGSKSQRKKELDDVLLKFVVPSLQPMSIVEEDCFEQMLKKFDPRYKLPSRRHLRDEMITTAYHKSVIQVAETVKNKFIAVTFDGWTSRTTQGYLVVTGHFVENGFIRAATLSVNPIPGRSTAENLAEILRENVIEKFPGIQVVCGVTDNAKNMISTCERMQWKNIPCAPHTIQLTINTAICKTKKSLQNGENDILKIFENDEADDPTEFTDSTVYSILRKSRRVASFFHRSGVATKALSAELKIRNLPDRKLIQSVYTRWNSSLEMLKSIHNAMDAIIVVLNKFENKIPPFSPLEIKAIPEIIAILEPFADTTAELSGDSYVTISLIIPNTKLLLNKMEEISGDIKTEIVRHFQAQLMIQIRERLLKYESRSISSIATVLDPRFKQHRFCDTVKFRNAVELIKNELKMEISKSIKAARQIDSFEIEENEGTPQKSRFAFLEQHRNSGAPSIATIPGSSQAIVHLNAYLEDKILTTDKADIVKYWNDYTACEPLKKIAFKYLLVPASSVPSERVNSTAGNIISHNRASLNPEIAEKLVFLRQNYEYLK